jgi:trk system potassium uptake protein TrkH
MRKHLNLGVIQRILGLLLVLVSVTMLVPAAVSLAYADGQADLFLDAFLILMAVGLLTWIPRRKHHGDLRLRDGFLVVALFWCVIGLAGAVPFFLAAEPRMSVTEAVFESVSGFTTTGATVLVGLDDLPPSIL